MIDSSYKALAFNIAHEKSKMKTKQNTYYFMTENFVITWAPFAGLDFCIFPHFF